MPNLVKFYTCTSDKFTAATKDPNALYFVSDTKRLYKGDVLYGGSFEYSATTLTGTGIQGTLYYEATTGEIKIYDGIGFVTKFIPYSTTVDSSSTDSTVATSKAVYTAVNAEAIVRAAADAVLSAAIDTLNGSAEGSVAKAVKDAKDALSGAIGSGFDSTSTVKKYVDDIQTATDADIDYVSGVVATINNTAETAGSFRAGDAALSAAIGGSFTADNTVADAIAALSGDAISVSGAADNAIEVTSSGTNDVNKTIGLKINANDKFLSQTSAGLSATFELVKADTLVSGDVNAAEYYLADKNGAQVGARINIPKDQFLKSVSFVEGTGSGDDKLHFVFTTAAGDVEQDVNLSGLFNEYTAGAGIALTETATGIEISGVIDGTSEEFLTVGANGFKLAGVQTAIDTGDLALSTAIGSGFAADKTVKGYIDGIQSTLSAQIGSGFGEGTTSGTVASYINTRITSEATRVDTALSAKLDDVDSGKANEIITATADGKVQTSGKKVGGSAIAAEPDADTVATEAAVSGFVDTKINDALTGALVWNTL